MPRVVRELFGQIATATSAGGGGSGSQAAARSFTVRMSMMEIYNEVGADPAFAFVATTVVVRGRAWW